MDGCSITTVESGHCLIHSTHLTRGILHISTRSNRLMNYGGMVSIIAHVPGITSVTYISIYLHMEASTYVSHILASASL
ncbi:hypothetical protein V8C44DRAFT_337676 [Trichoderma aethiopicum]